MKEVACAVCGAMYRFPAADIPPAGKTVSCAKCKARIVVPGDVAGGTGDVIDLADLPAPRRPSPTGVPGGRVEAVDLPAPKGPSPSAIVDLPAPKAVPKPREPEPFTLDGVDLVAPVGPSPRGAPAPADAPKATARGPYTDLPAPKGPPAGIVDLPAPKGPPAGIVDLPAPKGPPAGIVDLPAPKGPPAGIVDLPAPKGPPAISDLPMPKGPPAISDLPAPKRASGNDLFDDLPAPKGPMIGDLPTPKRPAAAPPPEPKRTVGGMPPTIPPARPLANNAQLPAPKGFFDDLPGPATGKGGVDLPAPKGFFDDLPGPATNPPAARVAPPSPASMFDDLPPAKSPAPAIGLFDDLPPPSVPRAERFPAPAPSVAPGAALEGIDLPPPSGGSGMIELEPTNASARSVPATPRTHAPSEPPPALELGDGDPLGLDLPASPAAAAAAGRGVVSFKAGASTSPGSDSRAPATNTGDIDLAVPRRDAPAQPKVRATPKAGPAKAKLSPRAAKLVLAAVLGVGAVGAGGFFMYKRWDAQQTRAADLDRNLKAARKAALANDETHWRRAARAADDVLALDKRNAEALGIAAQAALVAYVEEGTQAEARLANGRRLLETATTNGAHHPTVDKAAAVRDLIEGDYTGAIAALKPLAARGDADAQLYLGWAQAGAQEPRPAPATRPAAAVASTPPAIATARRWRSCPATGACWCRWPPPSWPTARSTPPPRPPTRRWRWRPTTSTPP